MTKRVLFIVTGLMAALLLVAVTVPSLRSKIQNSFSPVGNEVLATAEGDLLNDGSMAKVIKYRSEVGIYVEILKLESNGETQFIDRILLPDKRDGLFNYQGHVTRLAIGDIENSGKQDLLVPTFDNQLVPHLNVFRYNPLLKRFEPYQH
jgi:hypothetical protein